MKKYFSKEIRVGGMIIIALSIMIGAVFFIGGQGNLFGGKVKYKILFQSTAGLYEGDPVLLTGVEVGNVDKIGFPRELDQKKILVEISVAKEVASRIREDSKARVSSASIVYGKMVELTMGSMDKPMIREGGFIEAAATKGYEAIVGNTSLVLEDLRKVLLKIDQGEGAFGILLNEPMEIRETLHHLSLSTQKLSGILGEIEKGKGTLGELISDSTGFQQALIDLEAASADLKAVTQKLNSKEGTLGKLINDKEYGEAFTNDLRSTMHSLANITAKIDTGKGTIGWLINDDELFIGLQDVVLGIERSKISKWFIQNRRKSGEKARMREQKEMEEKQAN
jgi:phospholipid/cholesterol/gamma-HCH transport system substrate-binding protein